MFARTICFYMRERAVAMAPYLFSICSFISSLEGGPLIFVLVRDLAGLERD